MILQIKTISKKISDIDAVSATENSIPVCLQKTFIVHYYSIIKGSNMCGQQHNAYAKPIHDLVLMVLLESIIGKSVQCNDIRYLYMKKLLMVEFKKPINLAVANLV